jgi:DNA replication protein DnaC
MERALEDGEGTALLEKLRSSPNLIGGQFRLDPLLSDRPDAITSPDTCPLCDGTGWEPVMQHGIKRVRPCRCATERRKRKLLMRLPERFRDVQLENLAPCRDSGRCFTPVEIQAKAINVLKSQPNDGFAFFAPPGFGKSHFLAALYRHAVETQGRGCYLTQGSELIRDFRELELGREDEAYLNADVLERDLGERIRPRIFIDEMEQVPTLSQFSWAKMAEFFNVIYRLSGSNSSGVQLCLASNLTRDQFAEFWGGALLRRINEMCVAMDFFGGLPIKRQSTGA